MAPLLLIAFAAALRLGWLWAVPTKPVGDFAMYLESAAHLLERGALDDQFVYMPGYVLVLAGVQALGGGWMAAKVVGALWGALGAGAVYGIAHHLWDRRSAMIAGLLYAVWPAGIALASVTGTDVPAAVLIGVAGWCLVRWGPARPLRAAVLFGLAMGLAGWIRAVALPLTAFAVFFFRGWGTWRQALARTALACGVAALVLSPWAVRNKLHYGEVFFTDSHGGLTALVGANPNTDGNYSRSLNRMFQEAAGYQLLAEPHRESDRAAYALALDWTVFSPAYALGLLVTKAERLLTRERALLYWPIYRAGVLPEPHQRWFASRWGPIEALADAFWIALAAAGIFGLAVAAARRRWVALAFVPLQLALVAIYAVFFAEARYRLPIALLLFPPAGGALVWLASLFSDPSQRHSRGRGREALVGAIAVALVFGGWQALAFAGERLRERHRWVAHVCRVGGEALFCRWRPTPVADGRSHLRGVWDGVGVALPGSGQSVGGQTTLALPAGRHRIRARFDLAPLGPVPPEGRFVFRMGAAVRDLPLTELQLASRRGEAVTLEGEAEGSSAGVTLGIVVYGGTGAFGRLWLSELEVDPL